MRFWVGGYTSDFDGNAAGIGVLLAGGADEQSASGALNFGGTAVAAASPSWLAQHPSLDVVYAALEGEGAVRAFQRTGPESLAPFGPLVQTGTVVCHAAVSADGKWLVATGYGDGSVARMRLDADGGIGQPSFGAAAVDPYGVGGIATAPTELTGGVDLTDALASLHAAVPAELAHLLPAQPSAPAPEPTPEPTHNARSSRAHQTKFLPGGLIATTDIGFDLVRFWRDGNLVQDVVLPFGCGPRHMAVHPSGHLYVVTEYSGEIFALASNAEGVWRIVTATPASRETTVGSDYPAELTVSPDGTRLYTSIRGIDAIATVEVKGAGDRLAPLATEESFVDWPRHHLQVGDTMLVCGQNSNEIASLAIDARSQVVARRRAVTPVPTPSHLLPVFD